MMEVVPLATFLAFLSIGAVVAFTRGRTRIVAVNLLLVYVLGLHALLLVTARDDWPFTIYPLIEKVSNGEGIYRKIVFYGVDDTGREWPVDPDAWSPVSPPVLMQWSVT